ncbi:hypothetical protein AWB67_06485 [Caballeronia terrestris]|uniref:Uncharacterized protein n=1 Tax=Caballeronia terrestris TaxID=1226301 RepID=A0A158KRG5_9BURK|nr:hypothetical protein [Caballeronia terrestris]SAL83717.1 hypothetical protein AWB67_06485 [Caballeronia terrestris]
MKSSSPLIAGGAAAPPTGEPQIVVSPSTKMRPATTYASLLEGPLALLAGQVIDRSDLQSVAILGYN